MTSRRPIANDQFAAIRTIAQHFPGLRRAGGLLRRGRDRPLQGEGKQEGTGNLSKVDNPSLPQLPWFEQIHRANCRTVPYAGFGYTSVAATSICRLRFNFLTTRTILCILVISAILWLLRLFPRWVPWS